MKQADIIILIVSEVIFLLIMGTVMLPAVIKVVQSHHAVFQTFIQVPLPIIKAMRASVQKRINAIARAAEEAEVGIDIGGKGNEIEDDEDDMHALLAKQHDYTDDDNQSAVDHATDRRAPGGPDRAAGIRRDHGRHRRSRRHRRAGRGRRSRCRRTSASGGR